MPDELSPRERCDLRTEMFRLLRESNRYDKKSNHQRAGECYGKAEEIRKRLGLTVEQVYGDAEPGGNLPRW